jgi:signal transduction histidine kinase
MKRCDSVIVLAPHGRNAAVIASTLDQAGLVTELATDAHELLGRARADAGALVIAEEALTVTDAAELGDVLAAQPAWSDLPLLLLALPGARTLPTALRSIHGIAMLHRPIPAVSLVSSVRAALRARRRQYEVRDLIVTERLARERAEDATRVKDEFLTIVSHELRTPLAAILIWSKLLEAGHIDETQAHAAAQAIVSSAEAQSRLVEDLLDMSRMLTGKLRVEIGIYELAPILRAAAAVVRPAADAKGITLDVDLEPTSNLVYVDASRAQQIFWNVLSNAVKFTPRNGLVCVRWRAQEHTMFVEISDSGQGIHSEILPHVFERFRQATQGSRERDDGLGLGLSIVAQLVQLHGGTIAASSPGPNLGSTFTIALPLAPATAFASQST